MAAVCNGRSVIDSQNNKKGKKLQSDKGGWSHGRWFVTRELSSFVEHCCQRRVNHVTGWWLVEQ
uniref:Uncharacterized protein n=1 Tax=Timema genevievae TaxID=629358 RepID=A0A7R9JRF9_TIMGE|nr:unnamed protein product [Timema genevievae]